MQVKSFDIPASSMAADTEIQKVLPTGVDLDADRPVAILLRDVMVRPHRRLIVDSGEADGRASYRLAFTNSKDASAGDDLNVYELEHLLGTRDDVATPSKHTEMIWEAANLLGMLFVAKYWLVEFDNDRVSDNISGDRVTWRVMYDIVDLAPFADGLKLNPFELQLYLWEQVDRANDPDATLREYWNP